MRRSFIFRGRRERSRSWRIGRSNHCIETVSEECTANSVQAPPTVFRTQSLSAGSFGGNEDDGIQLDEYAYAYAVEKKTQSRDRHGSFLSIASVDSTEATATSYDVLCPDTDPELFQQVMSELTEQEKEQAARTSYRYACLTENAEKEGMRDDHLNRLRDRAAMTMFLNYYTQYNKNVKKALKKMRNTLDFREEKRINEGRLCFTRNNSEFTEKLCRDIREWMGPDGRMFLRGYDKDGRITLNCISRNSPLYSKRKRDGVGCLEAHCVCIEKALACTERKTDGKINTVNVCVDFEDFQLWHAPPTNMLLELIGYLLAHYSEHLHRVYLCDAPGLFRILWSIIRPALDAKTKAKFVFVNGEEERRRVFSEVYDVSESMPYMHPDGQLREPVDMEKYYYLPFDKAYDEE